MSQADKEQLQDFWKSNEAVRNPIKYRFDLICWNFLKGLAIIAYVGFKKYGELNWQKSRLKGESGPINHIYQHLNSYQNGEDYDHHELGNHSKNHLLGIAFNAMMEYWYEGNLPDGK